MNTDALRGFQSPLWQTNAALLRAPDGILLCDPAQAEAEPFAPKEGGSRAPAWFWLKQSHSEAPKRREGGSNFAPPAELIAPTAGTQGSRNRDPRRPP